MERRIANTLNALGHPVRLSLFRLLMRRYPDRVAAGELAAVLGLAPSTLSAHLATLRQAGLITQERMATSLRYAIDLDAVRAVFDHLLFDCCRGRPEVCSPFPADLNRGTTAMSGWKYTVLFLCTGNSARSIFAEALLRDLAGDRFDAHSAGTKPRFELDPFALEVLRQKGHDVLSLRSKHVAEFQTADAPRFDFVFTVCNRAAHEDCPAWPGQPASAHWGMPDPVKAEGTEAEKSLAFQKAYGSLRNRIAAFTALPFASLDRLSLQRELDAIRQSHAGADA